MPETPLGITYPASTAHTRMWEHLQQMAEDLDALITELKEVQVIDSGYTVVGSFTMLDFKVRLRPALGSASVWIYIRNDSAINILSGANIPDTTCLSLPVAARPPDTSSVGWGNGVNGGEAIIEPDGDVILRSAAVSIASGSNIRIFGKYDL